MNKRNFSSRKFILSVAAFLGSIGVSITGLATDERWVTILGIVCAVISTAIYAAVEAYVDGKSVSATTQHTEITEETGVYDYGSESTGD